MVQQKHQPVELIERVQHNCHLSDAHYARDYSLCIYLLKMREFYRWEQGIELGERLPKKPLGEWLTARESHWESLEEEDEFLPLELAGVTHAPFESVAINAQLNEQGLVYSGGYCGAKPHFFLAELESRTVSEGATIFIAGHELARELTAPPAMSLAGSVFLRRESLRRMIWEKLEEWGWQDQERAIARAAAFYRLQSDLQLGLDKMTADELDTLLQHELGELEIGRILGGEWEELLAALPRSRAEFQLRAIRDHLVDCHRTLPWLLDEGREAAVHFYFANFTTMRRSIFPSLQQAYLQWLQSGNEHPMRELCKRAGEHWMGLAQNAIALYREHGPEQVRGLLAINDEEKLVF